MSTHDYKTETEFWKKVGLVIIHTSDGVIIGRITAVSQNVLTMIDLHGFRHWINQEGITRIEELGENTGTS